ncbi:Bug family tripartite tricarboxylate transporter substrate binding protein [Falsiroseomonas selenitidurans]|uniref:Tripartite tricarboxylate transporter substrate binding protein n=1 Tax=Falsiroseomonas selenitidurans TaxID=2716335 RepID=A0ABX1E8V9_9PROT|nr:tripartite tricarboxylate transporter substrate binding protein [Falsiroseomonas selenitidurans]NKC32243.1 tripartite tricarboxylate transporter substrate binding protein [Falsiroseomonas selenitidurans]
MIRFSRRAVLLGTLAAPSLALGQTRRPLRVVVPFPPGGGVDSLGRLLAERLTPLLEGQQVVVENRSGGGGLIGADAVAKGPADGSIIGIIGAATLCAAPFIQPSMPFDVTKDFRAVTQVSDSAVVIAVGADVARRHGWTDMAALLAWAKANPGGARVANAGVGTVTNLALAAINTAAGVDLTSVPYRGGAQQAMDVIAGTVEATADLPAALLPHIAAGRMKALGVSASTRLAFLPEVPALAETPALAGIDIRSWNAIMAPAATPEAEVQRLFAAIARVGRDPSFAAALRPFGYDAVVSESPAAMAARILRETPSWRRLVAISGAARQ